MHFERQNIISYILKGILPFKMHKIIIFSRKKMCLKFSEALIFLIWPKLLGIIGYDGKYITYPWAISGYEDNNLVSIWAMIFWISS